MPHLLFTAAAFVALAMAPAALSAQNAAPAWSFAVSGDSRNCGDFAMPAIASAVKAEKDSFYWHLGDFALHELSEQDLTPSMWPYAPLNAMHECYIHNAEEGSEAK